MSSGGLWFGFLLVLMLIAVMNWDDGGGNQ